MSVALRKVGIVARVKGQRSHSWFIAPTAPIVVRSAAEAAPTSGTSEAHEGVHRTGCRHSVLELCQLFP